MISLQVVIHGSAVLQDGQYSVLSECRMGESQPMTPSLSPRHSHSGWQITHPHVKSDKERDRCR